MNIRVAFLSIFSFLLICLNVSSFAQKSEREREREREKQEKYKKNKDKYELIGETEEEENEEYDGPDKFAEFEFQRTKDPALGIVPRERLLRAIDDVKRSKANALARMQSGTSRSGSISLTWTERGPNSDVVGASNGNTRANNGVTAGRVRAVMVDSSDPTKKTVWVGGVDGGLWKTTDITTAPANWILINDFLSNLAVTDICQNPRGNGDTMYFCTGEAYYNSDAVKGNGVFKSTDHGVTWTQLSSTSAYGYCTRILCDFQGNIYLGTRGNGLLRSTNGGTSWTTITPSGLVSDICDMEISSTSGTARLHIVSGIFSTQAYRYTDIPATVTTSSGWNSPTTAFPSFSMRAEIACKGSLLYALPANASYEVPTIYKSKDGGATWAATGGQPTSGWASGQGWYNLSIDINPADTSQVIVGALDSWKTTNGGTSWTKISNWVGTTGQYVHADIHKILWYDGGNKLIYGCDGGIHFSSDGGTTIRDRNVGLRIKQFYSCAINPTSGSNQMLAGAQDNGVHLLNGAGLTSSTEVTGGDGCFVAIDQDQPATQFGSYVYNVYRRSLNTGSSWSSFSFYKGSSGSTNFGSFVNPFDYDNSNNIMYAGGDAGEYFRWNTGTLTTPGTYYTASLPSGAGLVTGQTAMNSSKVSTVCVSPYTAHRVYFGTAGGRIVYVNRADTATIASSAINITGAGMPTGSVSCIALGSSDRHIMATYTNYGVSNVWVSYNGGTTWTAIDGNLSDMPVRGCMFYPGDSTRAIIATEAGVLTTDLINGASTIWNASPSFPTVRTDMIRYRSSDGTLVAATHGRGLWTTTLTTCTQAVISASSNSPICAGQTLNITGTSDQATATYSWSGPNGFTSTTLSPSISNATTAATGTYTLTATYNGCPSTTSVTVAVNAPPVVSASNNGPLCSAQTLNLTATSNQPSSTYAWTGPNSFTSAQQNPSISNVTAAAGGTYQLTVSFGGCTSTASTIATISSNVAPVISAASNSPVCATQTLQLSGTSDQPSATISWSGPNGFTSTILSPIVAAITTAGAGTYTLTVSNAFCSSVTTTSVSVNPAPPVTSGVSICPGGSGSLSSSTTCSGYMNAGTTLSGSWNAATDPTAKIPTSVTNSTACSFATAVRNYNAINFQVNVSGTYNFLMTANTAYDGMGYIVSGAFVPGNCSGGGTFIIGDDDGGSDLEPSMTTTLSAGVTYTLISTTWGNTSGTYSGSFGWTVTPPSGGQIMLFNTYNINWYASATGGSILGSGVSFNPVGTAGSGLSNTNTAGTYTYYAECPNNTGCRAATNFVINANPFTPTVSVTQPTCLETTGTITVTSSLTGLNFSLDGVTYTNTTGVFTGLTPGSYNVTSRNSNNCISSTASVIVNPVPALPATPTANVTQPTCSVSTGTITVTSSITGLSFSIDGVTYTNTTGVFSGVGTGTYSLTCRDINGCTSSASSVTINAQPAVPSAPSVSVTQTTCSVATGTITVTSSLSGLSFSTNGTTYTNTTGIFTGLASGSYNVTARNSSGCTSSATVTIINPQPSTPAPPSLSITQPTCTVSTGTITVTSTLTGLSFSSNGTTYTNTTGVFTGVASGSYNITARNSSGCTSDVAVATVNAQPSTPTAPTVSITQPTCTVATGTITVTSSLSGLSFSTDGTTYTNTTGVITGISSGSYNVTARNSSGCTSTATAATVNTQPTIPAAPTTSNTSVCQSSNATLTATPPSGAVIDWYSASSGGTLLSSGSSSYSFILNATTTVYAQSRHSSSGCISVNRLASTATMLPKTSSTTSVSTCNLYNWNGTLYRNSGNYTFASTNSNGCDSNAILQLTINNCNTSLVTTLLIEGLYDGVGNRPVLYDLGMTGNDNISDSVEIELWSPSLLSSDTPSYHAKVPLLTNGTATASFTGATQGNSYYIAIKHRNSLETWSSTPVNFALTNSYNFSLSQSAAYNNGFNNPLKSMGNGRFAIYSGDVNQDGAVDLLDIQPTENNASLFQFGYDPTDVNGDGATDLLDLLLIENNAGLFIYYARPY